MQIHPQAYRLIGSSGNLILHWPVGNVSLVLPFISNPPLDAFSCSLKPQISFGGVGGGGGMVGLNLSTPFKTWGKILYCVTFTIA